MYDEFEAADRTKAIRLKAAYRERLSQAENGARNGRLFCALNVSVAISAFVVTRDPWFAKLAVVAAAPAGVACLLDSMPPSGGKSFLALVSYAVSALSALALLLTLG